MRSIAIAFLLLVSNIASADCVLQLSPREYRCDIEIEYGDEARDGLLVWGSGGVEITAPGIYFADDTEGPGTGEARYTTGWVGHRLVYGNNVDDELDPTTPMWVDGEPALGVMLIEEFEFRDLVHASGNWDRNGVPVSFSMPLMAITSVPEPSAFLLLGCVGLLHAAKRFVQSKHRILNS